mmetsp:Transcript_5767/g.17143  ORF Transcript_5767/g.17143 Transcript_5767/m.17143 type:complete len:277 (+) Transcript_5767:672-1502(+)
MRSAPGGAVVGAGGALPDAHLPAPEQAATPPLLHIQRHVGEVKARAAPDIYEEVQSRGQHRNPAILLTSGLEHCRVPRAQHPEAFRRHVRLGLIQATTGIPLARLLLQKGGQLRLQGKCLRLAEQGHDTPDDLVNVGPVLHVLVGLLAPIQSPQDILDRPPSSRRCSVAAAPSRYLVGDQSARVQRRRGRLVRAGALHVELEALDPDGREAAQSQLAIDHKIHLSVWVADKCRPVALRVLVLDLHRARVGGEHAACADDRLWGQRWDAPATSSCRS